jgi:drug/metabolite transporter (DMT)-like permease
VTVLGLLAALCVGLATAAQHHATQQVDEHVALHPGLALALLRRPWWLLGSVAAVAGLALQMAALAIGAIITVQTLMITSLAWTKMCESLLARRRPGGLAVAGVALVVCGIVALLMLLDPQPAPDLRTPTAGAVGVVAGGCAIVAAVGLVWSARRTGPARALGLALATGCAYGLTAALLKLVGDQLRLSWDEPFRHAALYAVCLLGPAAVLLSQNALQQGPRATPGAAVVLLVDPVVGLVCGVLWFGEGITTTVATVLVAPVCVAVTVAGIALAQTASLVDTDRFGCRRQGVPDSAANRGPVVPGGADAAG